MATSNLESRVAVVTGASRGLGKEMARSLAAAGAAVALVARAEGLLQEIAADIRKQGGKVEVLIADVTDETGISAVARRVEEKLGVCDILVNNAGINNRKPIEDFTLAEWNEILAVNLTGPFLMSRAFVPGMKKNRFGRILNLTSTLSHVSLPNRTGYSSTKAGLLGFTKSLALELAPFNITVNGISPGPFDTERNQPLKEDPEQNALFTSRIPLGRWGKAEEIGPLVVYLCSEQAGFITGTDIVIDGGWTAQ